MEAMVTPTEGPTDTQMATLMVAVVDTALRLTVIVEAVDMVVEVLAEREGTGCQT